MILPIIVRRCLLGRVAERLFAPAGGEARASSAWEAMTSTRFQRLPRRRVCGHSVPVATGFRSRLLGLAGLPRERAGAGLLIPRCASVHTIGMRFALDLVFLDRGGRVLATHRGVPPLRLVRCAGAVEVLEIPAQGGESAAATT
jgi:uncharacterized membrane protein (UPF0127 family)